MTETWLDRELEDKVSVVFSGYGDSGGRLRGEIVAAQVIRAAYEGGKEDGRAEQTAEIERLRAAGEGLIKGQECPCVKCDDEQGDWNKAECDFEVAVKRWRDALGRGPKP